MESATTLTELLRRMEFKEYEKEHYMAAVDESKLLAMAGYLNGIFCICREQESLSVVFTSDIKAEMEGLTSKELSGPFALITLEVYSDLMSVGLLAKVSNALNARGIGVNAISAFHHDHLLVPYAKKGEAMQVLEQLSKVV